MRTAPAVLALLLASLPACRLETRPPPESTRELEAVREVTTRFHDAIGASNLAAAQRLTWSGATVLAVPRGESWLLPAAEVAGRLYRGVNVRVVRTDVRIEGDVATAWLDLRLDPGTAAEREGDELLVLHRVAGVWRITHIAPAERPEAG